MVHFTDSGLFFLVHQSLHGSPWIYFKFLCILYFSRKYITLIVISNRLTGKYKNTPKLKINPEKSMKRLVNKKKREIDVRKILECALNK